MCVCGFLSHMRCGVCVCEPPQLPPGGCVCVCGALPHCLECEPQLLLRGCGVCVSLSSRHLEVWCVCEPSASLPGLHHHGKDLASLAPVSSLVVRVN